MSKIWISEKEKFFEVNVRIRVTIELLTRFIAERYLNNERLNNRDYIISELKSWVRYAGMDHFARSLEEDWPDAEVASALAYGRTVVVRLFPELF